MNKNITSVHIGGGFWAHIKWNENGQGVDQRGRVWYNRHNPKCEFDWLKPMCELVGKIGELIIKK